MIAIMCIHKRFISKGMHHQTDASTVPDFKTSKDFNTILPNFIYL